MNKSFDITGFGFSRLVGIIAPNAVAPEKGVYLIARAGLGQGVDIEYEVRVMDKGDSFDDISQPQWARPIAFHYIPEDASKQWIHINLNIHRFEDPSIPAPVEGIPIIAYREATRRKECPDVKYRLGSSIWHGVGQYCDVTSSFKNPALNGDRCWDEKWEGCTIIGFHMAFEYDAVLCRKHISLRREAEPGFLYD